MRVTIVASSLAQGGAERAAAVLAQNLWQAGYAVTLLTKEEASADQYEVPAGVVRAVIPQVIPAGRVLARFRAVAERMRRLREALLATQPAVVIAITTQINVRCLLALRKTDVPVIISEHNNPAMSKVRPWFRVLRRLMYKRAALLVSVSAGIDSFFSWLPLARRRVIHNVLPKDIEEARGAASSIDLSKKEKWIIACGRLVHQKGFDTLLQVFSLADLPSHWGLVILGEGPERTRLEQLVSELGLGDRVLLAGRVDNPFAVMNQADLFVLSSRYEGLPNVILEAMACGLPVISFDCPYGPAEIIRHKQSGWLVADQSAVELAGAMQELAESSALRAQLSLEGGKRAGDFSDKAITQQWQAAIHSVAR